MAIASYADFLTRLNSPRQRAMVGKISTGLGAGQMVSAFVLNSLQGTAPTTAAVPARNITGAIGQENGGATALRVPGIHLGDARDAGGMWILCDRLSHQGGLSGIVTTPQTTNLPTAALTRYTSGVGVMCGLEIYTAVGTTATTVTASYTNQAGTAGQTTLAVPFGGNGAGATARRIVLLPNAAGDNGFRAVASVTVLATTGTAGNFGVTLFKPLLFLPHGQSEGFLANVVMGTLGGGLPEILDDACLFWLFQNRTGQVASGQASNMTVLFAED